MLCESAHHMLCTSYVAGAITALKNIGIAAHKVISAHNAANLLTTAELYNAGIYYLHSIPGKAFRLRSTTGGAATRRATPPLSMQCNYHRIMEKCVHTVALGGGSP